MSDSLCVTLKMARTNVLLLYFRRWRAEIINGAERMSIDLERNVYALFYSEIWKEASNNSKNFMNTALSNSK